MARASCMTTYMPHVEDIILPPAHLWDDDGVPQWIELGWFNWKSRKAKNVGVRYGVRLHRNYLDSRFCPVHWLWIWLAYSKITSGPIWGNVTTDTYAANMKHILRVFMGVEGASSHTIRRSAAQWSGRCGDKGTGCRNAGRWQSFEHMMTYIAQGSKGADDFKGSADGDPIFKMWVFKPVTAAGVGEQDDM